MVSAQDLERAATSVQRPRWKLQSHGCARISLRRQRGLRPSSLRAADKSNSGRSSSQICQRWANSSMAGLTRTWPPQSFHQTGTSRAPSRHWDTRLGRLPPGCPCGLQNRKREKSCRHTCARRPYKPPGFRAWPVPAATSLAPIFALGVRRSPSEEPAAPLLDLRLAYRSDHIRRSAPAPRLRGGQERQSLPPPPPKDPEFWTERKYPNAAPNSPVAS